MRRQEARRGAAKRRGTPQVPEASRKVQAARRARVAVVQVADGKDFPPPWFVEIRIGRSKFVGPVYARRWAALAVARRAALELGLDPSRDVETTDGILR